MLNRFNMCGLNLGSALAVDKLHSGKSASFIVCVNDRVAEYLFPDGARDDLLKSFAFFPKGKRCWTFPKAIMREILIVFVEPWKLLIKRIALVANSIEVFVRYLPHSRLGVACRLVCSSG